jgi:hypothetical protein
MDNTNVKNIAGNITPEMIGGIVYHNAYSLLGLIKWFQANPALLTQAGVTKYNVQDLQALYTQLNTFIGVFSDVVEKKVS